MRRYLMLLTLMALGSTLTLASGQSHPSGPRRLSRAALTDKIRGGWAGQMIGVSYGAPTEFRSNGKIGDWDLKWSPERVSNALDQDDLYVEMTFSKVMDEIGLGATCEQYGDAFRDSKYNLWHANAGARRALGQGIKAPWSGHPKYNFHANDIDFQIEADFIGLMCPGLPQISGRFADRVAVVGKRLSDRLYVSYEQGLGAVATNLIKLDYALGRRWTLRAETGTSSGGGLFYRYSWD